MVESIVEALRGIHLTPQWITFFIAALPIVELRLAIPWALAPASIFGGGLGWHQAFLWAICGNFVPIIPLLLVLSPITNWLRRWSIFDRFFDWFFARTRKKGKWIERYEALGLIIFVGIPLPGTGVWTGAVAAFIFGIHFRYALPCITLGMLLAATLVTLASLGVIGIFST
jgi:uncharacterized membrane protein